MSLINNMLKDLEKKNKQTKMAESVESAAFTPPKDTGPTRNLKQWVVWLLIGIVVVIAFYITYTRLQQRMMVLPPHKEFSESKVQDIKAQEMTPSPAEEATEPKPIPAQAQEELKKVAVPLTTEEKAEQSYQRALEEISQYRVYQATRQLKFILNAYPDFMSARKTLVTILIKQNKLSEAKRYLTVGLQMASDDVDLITLQARVFMIENQPDQALAVLQQINPPLVGNTDYYSVLANLQQQLGNAMAAAHIYEQLLALQSNNTTWWVGLGIALEAAQRNNMAIQAYQRAVTTGNMNPKLQSYAESRLVKLGGG